MLRRFRELRRPLLAVGLAAALLGLCMLNLPRPAALFAGGTVSPCLTDMKVSELPPVPDDDMEMMKNLFTYITRPSNRTCRKVASFGGKAIVRLDLTPVLDGNKAACMDGEFGLASAEPCLVYSIGISDDWTFDWDMEMFGCDVFAFDPSINVPAGSQNGTITFSRYGVGERDYSDASYGWEVRTLDSLVRQGGHAARTIHYLKMDVEETEWAVLRQQGALAEGSTLSRNVEQLGMELHFTHHLPLPLHVDFYRGVYESFLRLQQMGFYPFSYEPNPTEEARVEVPGLAGKLPAAIEVVWLKTRCASNAGPVGGSGHSPSAGQAQWAVFSS